MPVRVGVGGVAVTFTVGGLSVINAIAGAYAENLPIICITGVSACHDIAADQTFGDFVCPVTRSVCMSRNFISRMLMKGI